MIHRIHVRTLYVFDFGWICRYTSRNGRIHVDYLRTGEQAHIFWDQWIIQITEYVAYALVAYINRRRLDLSTLNQVWAFPLPLSKFQKMVKNPRTLQEFQSLSEPDGPERSPKQKNEISLFIFWLLLDHRWLESWLKKMNEWSIHVCLGSGRNTEKKCGFRPFNGGGRNDGRGCTVCVQVQNIKKKVAVFRHNVEKQASAFGGWLNALSSRIPIQRKRWLGSSQKPRLPSTPSREINWIIQLSSARLH